MMKNKIKFLWMLMAISIAFSSCSKKHQEEFVPDIEEQPGVVLNIETVKLKAGQMAVVYASIQDELKNLDYAWRIENTNIAEIEVLKKDSVKVRALAAGKTNLYFESTDKSIVKNIEVTVSEKGTIKLLCIGNSYANDTVVRNLYELAEEQGIDLLIEVIYEGGTSLLDHWNNLQSNKAYSCYRIDKGVTTRPSQTFEEALKRENWDYISIQQVSSKSGKYETYEAELPPLMDFLKKNATNPDVKYVLHQTWANQADFVSSIFESYYGSSQSRMYDEIAATSKKVYENFGFDLLVPTGTTIQNARTSAIGDFYCRDGYHLELTYGRYTGACAYFQALFGELYGLDIRQSKYKNSISDFEAQVSREAAYRAVLKPYEITELTDYQNHPGTPTDPSFIVEGFEGRSKANYAKGDLSFPTGIWTLDESVIGSTKDDPKNGASSVRMRGGPVTMNFDYKGLKEITISYGIYPAAGEVGNPNPTTIDIEMSTDGGATYTFLEQILINTKLKTLSNTTIPLTVNPETPVRFRVVNSSKPFSNGTKPRINIDDFGFKF